MDEIDREIFKAIWESSDPEQVAKYALSLCLEYLQNLESSQVTTASSPLASA